MSSRPITALCHLDRAKRVERSENIREAPPPHTKHPNLANFTEYYFDLNIFMYVCIKLRMEYEYVLYSKIGRINSLLGFA